MVDTRGTSETTRVSVYVTNLAMVDADYISFALPVQVLYAARAGHGSAPLTGACSVANGCDWQPADGTGAAPAATPDRSYLIDGTGKLSVGLPGGATYEIAMPTGGSFVCASIDQSSSATLQPSFFFSLSNA